MGLRTPWRSSRAGRYGHIGQTSFEKLLSPSAMKIGADQGIGCYADKLPEDERAKTIIPDEFRHEIATALTCEEAA